MLAICNLQSPELTGPTKCLKAGPSRISDARAISLNLSAESPTWHVKVKVKYDARLRMLLNYLVR
jgi:hypothetical protein